MLFISNAIAQDASVTEPSALTGLLPVVVMIVLFYFLLIRPQQKKINAHKKLIEALRRGDKVLTSGGIYGTISKVEDDFIQLEVATDIKVKLDKNSISTVLTRSEPADKKA